MEKGELPQKFALLLLKAAWRLTFSTTNIKSTFIDKPPGIQDIEVVLKDRVEDLDLIALEKKA